MPINTLYPLRIIGLNQDEKASGGMAGLTFIMPQTDKSLSFAYQAGTGHITWGSSGHALSLQMQSIRQQLPTTVQNSIEPVIKKQRSNTNNIASTNNYENISTTTDSIFVLSVNEAARNIPAGSLLGVGPNKDESYLHWSNDLSDADKRARLGSVLSISDTWARDSMFANTGWVISSWRGGYGGGVAITTNCPIAPAFCF